MDELIRMVSEKAGIGQDAARSAVDTVLGFLKEKLPAPIAGQIDAAIGSGPGQSASEQAFDKVRGTLGRK
ncbi:MAG: DUF2267 domain-containing protein [Anaerolineae bacterium]